MGEACRYIASIEYGYGKRPSGEDGLESRGLLYELWRGADIPARVYVSRGAPACFLKS
jgi:hypothetical protein